MCLANSEFLKLQTHLEKSLVSNSKAYNTQNKKIGVKKNVNELQNNSSLLEHFFLLRQRIVELASEYTLEQHFVDFQAAITVLNQFKELQIKFFEYQTKLNNLDSNHFNPVFIELRNDIFVILKAHKSKIEFAEPAKLPSILFHVLLSFTFVNFEASDFSMSELYLDFLNEIQANATVFSQVSLRAEASTQSTSLGMVNKNTILKVIKQNPNDHWIKLIAYLDDREIVGFLPRAYIRLTLI